MVSWKNEGVLGICKEYHHHLLKHTVYKWGMKDVAVAWFLLVTCDGAPRRCCACSSRGLPWPVGALLHDLPAQQLVLLYPGLSDAKTCCRLSWSSEELEEMAVCEQLNGGLEGREPER